MGYSMGSLVPPYLFSADCIFSPIFELYLEPAVLLLDDPIFRQNKSAASLYLFANVEFNAAALLLLLCLVELIVMLFIAVAVPIFL